MRKTVGIILFNSSKKILVQLRTDDAPVHPNKWSFFGGGIEQNESPLEAVKRECFEELGHLLKNPTKIFAVQVKELNSEIVVFIENFNSKQKLSLNEGKDMKWISTDDIPSMTFQPGLKEMLPQIFNSIDRL